MSTICCITSEDPRSNIKSKCCQITVQLRSETLIYAPDGIPPLQGNFSYFHGERRWSSTIWWNWFSSIGAHVTVEQLFWAKTLPSFSTSELWPAVFALPIALIVRIIWVLFLLILDFLSLLMAPLQEKQHVRDAQWHSHTSQHYQPLLQPSVSCWKWVLLKFHGTYYPSPKVTLLHLLSLQMSACNIVQKVTITKGSSALDWYRAWKQVMEFQFNLVWSNSKDILAGLQQDSSNYKDNCLHQI